MDETFHLERYFSRKRGKIQNNEAEDPVDYTSALFGFAKFSQKSKFIPKTLRNISKTFSIYIPVPYYVFVTGGIKKKKNVQDSSYDL